MADFANDLAEKYAHWDDEVRQEWVEIVAYGALHARVDIENIPVVRGLELARIRGLLASLIEAGIEEGRRQAGGASPEALEAAREEGRRLGWEQAMGRLSLEAEQRREACALAQAAAERARLDWVTAEVARDVLAAAAPGGER